MECLDEEYSDCYRKIKNNWDKIAKPLDSLGKFEDLISKLGAIQKKEFPSLEKCAVVILCSDNGIVEEGVSQSDQSVTRICAENIAAGKTTVGIMAKSAGAEILTYDVGINWSEKIPGVKDFKISSGTKNFLKEPAMTLDQLRKGIAAGKKIAFDLKAAGYDALCVGEMGIGNTTTSAAVSAALLKLNADQVAGRGAGLSDEGLQKKINVIQKAISKYNLYEATVEDVLRTVGGFDIVCMAGLYLGAKENGIPVILDGAISLAACLAAERIEEGTKNFLLPSHKSREPLVNHLLKELELSPVLDADMALGEGTGAVLMLGVLKTVLQVYKESVPFSESNVEQYTRFK